MHIERYEILMEDNIISASDFHFVYSVNLLELITWHNNRKFTSHKTQKSVF